jgi:hypothetical protein
MKRVRKSLRMRTTTTEAKWNARLFETLAGSWHKGSKFEIDGVFVISMKFLVDSVPYCQYLKFPIFAGLEATDHVSY